MLTNSMKQFILNNLVGRGGSNAGSAYLALSSTAPNAEGGGVTEPVGNGYARTLIGGYNQPIKMTNASVDLTTGVATTTNDQEIHFNEATGAWGTLTHFAIYTTLTGGTPRYVGQLVNAITPTANNVVIIRVGDITITLQ